MALSFLNTNSGLTLAQEPPGKSWAGVRRGLDRLRLRSACLCLSGGPDGHDCSLARPQKESWRPQKASGHTNLYIVRPHDAPRLLRMRSRLLSPLLCADDPGPSDGSGLDLRVHRPSCPILQPASRISGLMTFLKRLRLERFGALLEDPSGTGFVSRILHAPGSSATSVATSLTVPLATFSTPTATGSDNPRCKTASGTP